MLYIYLNFTRCSVQVLRTFAPTKDKTERERGQTQRGRMRGHKYGSEMGNYILDRFLSSLVTWSTQQYELSKWQWMTFLDKESVQKWSWNLRRVPQCHELVSDTENERGMDRPKLRTQRKQMWPT